MEQRSPQQTTTTNENSDNDEKSSISSQSVRSLRSMRSSASERFRRENTADNIFGGSTQQPVATTPGRRPQTANIISTPTAATPSGAGSSLRSMRRGRQQDDMPEAEQKKFPDTKQTQEQKNEKAQQENPEQAPSTEKKESFGTIMQPRETAANSMLLHRLKGALIRFGGDGVPSLLRAFRIRDLNHSGKSNIDQFLSSVRFAVGSSSFGQNELESIFNGELKSQKDEGKECVDDENREAIEYVPFVDRFAPALNQRRTDNVNRSYSVVDPEEKGIATIEYLQQCYTAPITETKTTRSITSLGSSYSRPLSATMGATTSTKASSSASGGGGGIGSVKSTAERFKDFLSNFDMNENDDEENKGENDDENKKEGKTEGITKSDFNDYYRRVSAGVADDSHFQLLLWSSWRPIRSRRAI